MFVFNNAIINYLLLKCMVDKGRFKLKCVSTRSESSLGSPQLWVPFLALLPVGHAAGLRRGRM